MATIQEPARTIPVIDEADVCVVGGSATGVFAAVRAARLGARVIIIEKQNSFGGVATSGLVNIWHSKYDTEFGKQIIGGLTTEVMERLDKRNAVIERKRSHSSGFVMNTEELKNELDEIIVESKVIHFLHTLYVAPHIVDGKLDAVVVENKSGRGAVRAKFFIDASGDGDLAAHLGLPNRAPRVKQPPTTCMKVLWNRIDAEFDLDELIHEHREEFGLPEDWGWRCNLPNTGDGITMHADIHVFDADCTDGRSLSDAEIEGRRQNRAILDIVRKYVPGGNNLTLLDLSSYIGIREARHFECSYQLTEEDVLTGKRFPDAIANGSYRVDIHHEEKPGITFRYLDGSEVYFRRGHEKIVGRWREETTENPTFYQIPYRCLVPPKYDNLLLAGRMIDSDKGAYGAIRVMVNMNQTGEAAGVAAWLALDTGRSAADIDVETLRERLASGGSIVY
jgi:hypothetical protein